MMESSERREDGSSARAPWKRPHEGAVAPLCLLFLTLLTLDPVHGDMEVIQPPFVAVTIGGSVSLNCRFVHNTENISRKSIYWYIKPTDKEEVIYPGTKTPYKDRLTLSETLDNVTDKSIQISDLRFNDTMVYYCMMSIVTLDSKNVRTVNGTGTLLFVHGALSLKTVNNSTSLVCEAQVWRKQDIAIVWKEEGKEVSAENMTIMQTDLGTYWITSQLNVNFTHAHPVDNKNVTCLLRHATGGDISHRSMAVYGKLYAGGRHQQHKEPTLLYVLLLVNPMIILAIVLVIFKLQDTQKRRRC